MKSCSSSLSVISLSKMLFSCSLSQQGGIGQSSGLGGGVARTSGIGGGGIIRTSHTYTSSAQIPTCAAAEIQGKNCKSFLYSNATKAFPRELTGVRREGEEGWKGEGQSAGRQGAGNGKEGVA